jgi:hypothetical protein
MFTHHDCLHYPLRFPTRLPITIGHQTTYYDCPLRLPATIPHHDYPPRFRTQTTILQKRYFKRKARNRSTMDVPVHSPSSSPKDPRNTALAHPSPTHSVQDLRLRQHKTPPNSNTFPSEGSIEQSQHQLALEAVRSVAEEKDWQGPSRFNVSLEHWPWLEERIFTGPFGPCAEYKLRFSWDPIQQIFSINVGDPLHATIAPSLQFCILHRLKELSPSEAGQSNELQDRAKEFRLVASGRVQLQFRGNSPQGSPHSTHDATRTPDFAFSRKKAKFPAFVCEVGSSQDGKKKLSLYR